MPIKRIGHPGHAVIEQQWRHNPGVPIMRLMPISALSPQYWAPWPAGPVQRRGGHLREQGGVFKGGTGR